MGPIRALAQEPVQNSKDAAPRGRAHVEYRIYRYPSTYGEDSYTLTVMDSNTSGLQGPVRSLADLAQGGALDEGENWAAFEGMGYTKKSTEESLGSRGQGKAAYLYHSKLPPLRSSGQDRMMMLYDTLLPDGEYRLGVRCANPSDAVRQPPFLGDEARRIVSTRYAEHGTEVNLNLEPLTQVGTRVIVPSLSQEAVDAVQSRELYNWLQRCWWRAIQTGLTIDVVDEGGSRQSVAVPQWWASEPWRQQTSEVRAYEDVAVPDDLRIKRIVLRYDESPGIADSESWGVQLLRGRQWIETLGQETLGDYIPRQRRSGFRGFVEFDRGAERELRRAENPQHEHFDRRVTGVKNLLAAIESKVREFAEEQGWTRNEATRPAPEGDRQAALEFLRFLSPRRRTGNGTRTRASEATQLSMDLNERWACDLLLDFPNPDSTRVNWSEHVRNVRTAVSLEPAPRSCYATATLEIARADDRTSRVAIDNKRVDILNGHGVAMFGDFQIITGSSGSRKVQCAQRGKWRLTTRIEVGGVEVARSSRIMFVHEDPPARPAANPYALSISIENHTTQQRRINRGDVIGVQVSVTNRTTAPQTLELTASLGGLLLADRLPVHTDGTALGATPIRVAGMHTSIVVNPNTADTLRESVNLPLGRHDLRADLYLAEEIVAHAVSTLDIEVDPSRAQDWPPFLIEQVSGDGPHPRWQFDKQNPNEWVLRYPPAYPLYRALEDGESRTGTQLAGVSAFVVDVCAEGIIEWALESLDRGDQSRLDELLNGIPPGVNQDRWEDYSDKMWGLANLRNHWDQLDEYGLLVRDCAARSLSLFEGRG